MSDVSIEEWPAAPPPEEYFRVGASRTTVLIDPLVAREVFRRYKAIQVACVLEPALLTRLIELGERAAFRPAGHATAGFREAEDEPVVVGKMLNLLLNRPELLRWLEVATECGPVHSLAGRLVQTLNRPSDYLFWHDDLKEETNRRRLAVVINLGPAYEGGVFQLRRKRAEKLFAYEHATPGTALIFRVSPELEHRVLPLTAGGPRRVFAGWANEGAPQ